ERGREPLPHPDAPLVRAVREGRVREHARAGVGELQAHRARRSDGRGRGEPSAPRVAGRGHAAERAAERERPDQVRAQRADADVVSVVIPAYRHERYVAAALDSVRAQTLAPRDVVVVDDGSPDRTADIVAERFPDATLLRQPNRGAHAALDRAIAAAEGSWIA